MAQGNAKVMSGLRGTQKPGNSRERDVAAILAYRQQSRDPNVRVYRAKASKYVFVLTNPQEIFNPVTGRKDLTQKGKVLKFKNYVLETSDPEAIERLEKSNDFGLGRDFWLLEDEQKVQISETVGQLIVQLATLQLDRVPQEIKDKLTVALGAEVKPEFDPNATGVVAKKASLV